MTRKTAITFIDLFAGIGGIRTGFEQAGFQCVYSNEKDEAAAKTYMANHGDLDIGDIRDVDEASIPRHDVLCAGFPCQPFSKAGVSARMSRSMHHGFKDKNQGTLFFEIIRILRHHKPRAVFLENVANLERHDKGRTLKRIEKELKALDYTFEYHVFDASLVVPHRRKRIYIVALQKPYTFAFPKIRQRKRRLAEVLEKRVAREFTISDLLWRSHKARTKRNKKKGNGFAHYLVDVEGIANTLTARYGKDGRENLIPQKNKNPRMLTPRECARLMGFPDNFEIPVPKTPAYRQFGNSVCVPIIKALAMALAKQIPELEIQEESLKVAEIPAVRELVLAS